MRIRFDNISEVIRVIDSCKSFMFDNDINVRSNALRESFNMLTDAVDTLRHQRHDVLTDVIDDVDLTTQYHQFYIKHCNETDDIVDFKFVSCISELNIDDIVVYKFTCKQQHYDSNNVRKCTVFVYSTFDNSLHTDTDFDNFVDMIKNELDIFSFHTFAVNITQLV